MQKYGEKKKIFFRNGPDAKGLDALKGRQDKLLRRKRDGASRRKAPQAPLLQSTKNPTNEILTGGRNVSPCGNVSINAVLFLDPKRGSAP